jgi:uncharacterized protein YjbJ (UPF0337 family)
MNKDEIKGKAKDIKGRVERQAGEWTGNKEAQMKGAADQVKGKMQSGVGKMKDAGNKMMHDLQRAKAAKDEERSEERPRGKKAA